LSPTTRRRSEAKEDTARARRVTNAALTSSAETNGVVARGDENEVVVVVVAVEVVDSRTRSTHSRSRVPFLVRRLRQRPSFDIPDPTQRHRELAQFDPVDVAQFHGVQIPEPTPRNDGRRRRRREEGGGIVAGCGCRGSIATARQFRAPREAVSIFRRRRVVVVVVVVVVADRTTVVVQRDPHRTGRTPRAVGDEFQSRWPRENIADDRGIRRRRRRRLLDDGGDARGHPRVVVVVDVVPPIPSSSSSSTSYIVDIVVRDMSSSFPRVTNAYHHGDRPPERFWS
jgi:hypothetical protein